MLDVFDPNPPYESWKWPLIIDLWCWPDWSRIEQLINDWHKRLVWVDKDLNPKTNTFYRTFRPGWNGFKIFNEYWQTEKLSKLKLNCNPETKPFLIQFRMDEYLDQVASNSVQKVFAEASINIRKWPSIRYSQCDWPVVKKIHRVLKQWWILNITWLKETIDEIDKLDGLGLIEINENPKSVTTNGDIYSTLFRKHVLPNFPEDAINEYRKEFEAIHVFYAIFKKI